MTSTSTWPPIWRTADVTTIMSNVKLLISLQKGSIVYFDFLSSVFRCQSTTHAIIHVRTSKFMEKVFVFSLYTRYSSWKLNVCLLLLLQQLAKGYFSIPIWCVCRLPLSIKSSTVHHHQVGVISTTASNLWVGMGMAILRDVTYMALLLHHLVQDCIANALIKNKVAFHT